MSADDQDDEGDNLTDSQRGLWFTSRVRKWMMIGYLASLAAAWVATYLAGWKWLYSTVDDPAPWVILLVAFPYWLIVPGLWALRERRHGRDVYGVELT